MLRKLIVTAGFLLFLIGLQAQTFEEYMKEQKASYNKFKKEQEEGMKKLAEDLKNYRAQQNKEFADYLKKPWQKVDIKKAEPKPPEPKPDVVPPFKPEPAAKQKAPKRIVPKGNAQLQAEEVPLDIQPVILPDRPVLIVEDGVPVPFYQQEVRLSYKSLFDTDRLQNANQESIQQFWEKHAEKDFGQLIGQLWQYKQKMNLNDWGYYLLIKAYAEEICGSNDNKSRLIAWLLLNQSGYKARIGSSEGEAFLMLAITNKMYGMQFVDKDSLRYYIAEGKPTRLMTYPKEFPAAKRVFDMNLYSVLNFENQGVEKVLTAADKSEFTINLPENNLKFYADYPQSQLEVYFDAGMSSGIKNGLLSFLAGKINELDEQQKVSYLLNFVQNTFEYKTDDEQFGREKWFFPEELFEYPYSDCEDRSVLFSWLVRKLCGLETCALKYPGHAATAVAFTEDVAGDYVMLEERKFTVCDPTYINAPIGMAMPQFEGVQPEVIVLRPLYSPQSLEQKLLNRLLADGAYPANGQTWVKTADGNIIMAGCFDGDINLFGKDISSVDGSRDIFLAAFDGQAKMQWIRTFGGPGSDFVQGISLTNDGLLSLAGTFEGNMYILDKELAGEGVNGFIFNTDTEGMPMNLRKFPLDQQWVGASGGFVAQLNNGDVHVEQFPTDRTYPVNGMRTGNSGEQVFLASFANTPVHMDAVSEYIDFVPAMKELSSKFSKSSSPEASWMLAFLELIAQSGSKFEGSELLDGIRSLNPEFEKEHDWLADAIRELSFLKNDQGLVEVIINKGDKISLSNMRLQNKTRFKVSMLPGTGARIDFYGGANVGKAVFWYPLNNVIIENQGDMVLDYDDDHTRKRLNIKKDLL